MLSAGQLTVGDGKAAKRNLSRRLLADGERLAYILYTSGRGAEARRILAGCMRDARRINADAAKLLFKTFIPHALGRRLKHAILGERPKND
jgi:hypothetical protein